MVLVTRLWRTSLVSFLCVVLAAPVYAATNIYMSITGGKPGQFAGDSKSPHGSQWIPIVQINESVAAPRDSATGQASGKRQHEPIKVVKEIDASSPQLRKAVTTGEHLKEVVFQFYRSGAQGKDELYETIRLSDAIITGIENRGSGNAGRGERPTEEISFEYEKIEFTYAQQKQAPAAAKPAPAVVKPVPPQPR
jgi:type VI secretion system secreted protein Hcp